MILVAVGPVLVGDGSVGGGALVEEMARQRPGGEAAAAQLGEAMLVVGV